MMMQGGGGVIFGMDATYKTTLYGYPMFIVTAVTNHSNAFPVALFFVESETSDMIAQALVM